MNHLLTFFSDWEDKNEYSVVYNTAGMDLHNPSTDGKKTTHNLHKLVEKSSLAHKQDIQLYTSGHLNFNKFTNKGSKKGQFESKWIISKPKKSQSPRVTPTSGQKKLKMMSDALFDFSLGSTGIIPLDPSSSSARLFPTQSQEKLEKKVFERLEKEMTDQSVVFPGLENDRTSSQPYLPTPPTEKKLLPVKKQPRSKICVEELKLPELMLSPLDGAFDMPPSVRMTRSPGKQPTDAKKFITTHLAGITSKDRFQKMMDFEENILQTSELKEKSAFDGHKAVAHLESKLVSKLLLLQLRDPAAGPSFDRLQIYAEVWSDLVMDSFLFGDLLGEIKKEYDGYFSALLDSVKYTDRSDLLRSKHVIDDAATKLKFDKAEELQREVEELESTCRTALIRNYTLRQNIDEELHRIDEERREKKKEENEAIKRSSTHRRAGIYNSMIDVANDDLAHKSFKVPKTKMLQNMRKDIWKQIDIIEELKQQLKESYVPKALYRNVLHAIKDMELEIQRLRQQHAYLSQHKQELTEQMKNSLEVEGVDEKVMEKIWEMIESNVSINS